MSDADKPVPPVELSGGVARVLLDPADVPAFQDWQRLSTEEKESLIWMAEHHPSIVRLVRLEIWTGQTAYGVLRLAAIAGAILGLLAFLRQFGFI